jgi:hypothetical protein
MWPPARLAARASSPYIRRMKNATKYLTFELPRRSSLVRITDEVAAFRDECGLQDGMILVSAMHITAAVFVNDDGKWLVHFGPHPLAIFDVAAKKVRPLATALAGPKVEQLEDHQNQEAPK